MNRIDFIRKASTTFTVLNSFTVIDLFASIESQPLSSSDLGEIDESLRLDFEKLIKWMQDNGWEEFLLQQLNQSSIPWKDDVKLCSDLNSIVRTRENGFDDFGGKKLIEPGNPSLSLLYHALASPRVKNSIISAYPSIEQLDVAENFIYGLKKWERYEAEIKKDNLHVMVLAYEYRPAFKTPALRINNFEYQDTQGTRVYPKHAQLVFSRSGISRVGNHKMNYDPESRSYTNKPSDSKYEKEIAVTPSRFAVFLVELVEIKKDGTDSIKVMNVQENEFTTFKGDTTQHNRQFIRPVRKIFNDDFFNVQFAQYHLNQKLFKFSQFELHGKKIAEVNAEAKWQVTTFPFKRVCCMDEEGNPLALHSNDLSLVQLTRTGSSVLLSSSPGELIRPAMQDGKILSFFVEPKWERRYNALKLTNKKNIDIYDGFFTEYIFRRRRLTSRFRAMRNAPLFTNIKYPVNNGAVSHLDEKNADMENVIKNGGYRSLLFEDNMCDGCVSAKVTLTNKKGVFFDFIESRIVSPAFSIVAAPDFFPYLDSNDIRKYYHTNLDRYTGNAFLEIKIPEPVQEQEEEQIQLDTESITNDEHFLEGGSLNLSGIRQRGNPDICDPFTGKQAFQESYSYDKSFDTLVAVVSHADKEIEKIDSEKFKDNFRRDYSANSFLPDTGTGIFYPGWDATYSGDKINPYFGTFGLGSPFPEDMKLCAAANGMWPVASPDAGRTFQGSLDPFPILGKPNTSIPLMDDEIGYHPNSPHVSQYGKSKSYGWDGEQGPFIMVDQKDSKLKVNFTDIGRADYVANLLDPSIGFDMSKLRKMNSSELINRMDCLRKAIKTFDHKKVWKTKFWLISAEKVNSWEVGADASGIPNNLIGNSNDWARKSKVLKGKGYLFVFALTHSKSLKKELEPGTKRRNQEVKCLSVCKVSQATKDTYAQIEWCEFDTDTPISLASIKWQQ